MASRHSDRRNAESDVRNGLSTSEESKLHGWPEGEPLEHSALELGVGFTHFSGAPRDRTVV